MPDQAAGSSEVIQAKIPVGVSSCLLGELVRYDGGHRHHSYITRTLGQMFELQPFCPEMAIGLGVPRPTIHRVHTAKGVRVVGVEDSSLDVTDRLQSCAHSAQSWQQQLCGYIVKSRSPSCGLQGVSLQRDGVDQADGAGLYTELLVQNNPWLPVQDEERLGEPAQRDNFIERVFFLHRWRRLLAGEFSWPSLKKFHRQNQLLYRSRDPEAGEQLDAEVSASSALRRIDEFAGDYLAMATALLGQLATRERHTAILQEILGGQANFKAGDRAALDRVLDDFQFGQLPLVAVKALFKHYLEKYPDAGQHNSAYFFQYPESIQERQ